MMVNLAARASTQGPDHKAVVAMTRFGYGAWPGRRQAIRSDPAGALLAEIRNTASAELACDLPGMRPCLALLKTFQQARKARSEGHSTPSSMAPGSTLPTASLSPMMVIGFASSPSKSAPSAGTADGISPRDLMLAEAALRLHAATSSPTPMVERLVSFWSNHFCVDVDKDAKVMVLAGPYERMAIRPHVLGRFKDMLLAVMRHPAMLTYLDNDSSVGPNSRSGQKTRQRPTENLAREILELHTVGVGAGYSQADVTAFACALTGWTFRNDTLEAGKANAFTFRERAHEPSAQTIMGRHYPDNGEAQAAAVLSDLASHPATARHLAVKLCAAFLGDPPPASLVDRLTRRFLDTDGDLREVTLALLEAPEAWSAPRQSLVTPYGFVAAISRVADLWRGDIQPPLRALQALGEPLWRPPAPNGFHGPGDAWLAPAAIKTRLEVALQAAHRIAMPDHPVDVAADLYGDVLSSDTEEALRRCADKAQGYALMFMSPEFQRI